MKRSAKRAVVRTVGYVAPLTWRWRKPGSLLVLTYHRVLPTGHPALGCEQPGMYVSPETLDLHLTELKRDFELVHLDDWLRRAKDGASLPRLACALTFDDGWRDNYDFALPVLLKHEAPGTIFLVSSYIGTSRRFWPNRLMGLVRREFAQSGSVTFPSVLREIVEPVLSAASERGSLRPDDVDAVVQAAKRWSEQDIRALVESAEQGQGAIMGPAETLRAEDVAKMAATGLVRFGSHTVTHFRLGGQVSSEALKREVVDSREQLRDMCGQDIDLFCYPNGETSPEAVHLVRQHYLGAVTTHTGWHTANGDPHLMPRIGLHEDVSNTSGSFLARLSAWL